MSKHSLWTCMCDMCWSHTKVIGDTALVLSLLHAYQRHTALFDYWPIITQAVSFKYTKSLRN